MLSDHMRVECNTVYQLVTHPKSINYSNLPQSTTEETVVCTTYAKVLSYSGTVQFYGFEYSFGNSTTRIGIGPLMKHKTIQSVMVCTSKQLTAPTVPSFLGFTKVQIPKVYKYLLLSRFRAAWPSGSSNAKTSNDVEFVLYVLGGLTQLGLCMMFSSAERGLSFTSAS